MVRVEQSCDLLARQKRYNILSDAGDQRFVVEKQEREGEERPLLSVNDSLLKDYKDGSL